jgi:prevent-host-death family protein
MSRTVTAADANRQFSRLLQEVKEGRSFIVTSHGRPVAKLSPPELSEETAAAARTALFSRLRRQPLTRAARWTRDELYEDVE